MHNYQEGFYSGKVNYRDGSPHLAHVALYDRLVATLRSTLRDLSEAGLPLTVLEIGSGHGGYTEPALAAGWKVTAVEMSRSSLDRLSEHFGTNPNFRGVFDADGALAEVGSGFSLILCVSVLHHIPDYLQAIDRASSLVLDGGAFLSLQDPMWYARQSRVSRALDRSGYYAWRLRRGHWIRGTSSVIRRARGHLDEQNPSDMVEYHVVRRGVDEQAVRERLLMTFRSVSVMPYWSNQSAGAQRIGTRLRLTNTFGVLATGRGGASPSHHPELGGIVKPSL